MKAAYRHTHYAGSMLMVLSERGRDVGGRTAWRRNTVSAPKATDGTRAHVFEKMGGGRCTPYRYCIDTRRRGPSDMRGLVILCLKYPWRGESARPLGVGTAKGKQMDPTPRQKEG